MYINKNIFINISSVQFLYLRDYVLLEPHNQILLDLFFELATWHGLAKLKMHTESTLQDLNNSLTCLEKDLHHFKKITYAVYITCNFPSEIAAQGRRTAALAVTYAQSNSKAKSKTTGTSKSKKKSKAYNMDMTSLSSSRSKPTHQQAEDTTEASAPKQQNFNLLTSKLHALGDYIDLIWHHRTTNNYSTQIVSNSLTFGIVLLCEHLKDELAHWQVKQMFPVVQKSIFILDIAKYEEHQWILNKTQTQAPGKSSKSQNQKLGKSGGAPDTMQWAMKFDILLFLQTSWKKMKMI